jgi:glycosyltransferase involved in cell wall biosynthesis
MLAPWFRTAYQVKHLKKQLFWLAFEGRALRQARCVLFTTEEECRQARGAFWGHSYRERVIAYGTADVGGDPSQQIAAFCTKFTALSGRRFLLSLGRLHPTKGCDILISAFAKVAAFEKDLDLVMAGPDQIGWQIELERLAAEQGISERIHWTGMLTGDAKWGAFRAANAFISASHSESFGISAVEAMACGTPVLITNKFNTWREIQASQGGLVGEDSETGMVTILGDFLARSPNETAKMRIASRHGYLHYFNIENAAASLVRIIEELR